MRAYFFWSAAGLVAGLLLAAPPGARAQTVPEVLKSFEGERRILRSYGDRSKTTLAYARPRMGNDCDMAVEILHAEYHNKAARFSLDPLGKLNVGGRIPLCGKTPKVISFTITGVRPEENPERLRALLDKFLMTPEAYLAERGVGFEIFLDEQGNEVVRQRARGMDLSERQAGGDCWLVVYAQAPRGARKEEMQQGVTLKATLEADAAFHDPNVVSSPGARYNRQALRALSMWRCEPSVEKGEPEPLELRLRVRFR